MTGLGGERGRVDLCHDKNLAFPAQEELCNTPTARTRGKPSVLTAPFPHTAPEQPEKFEKAPGCGFNSGPSPQDEGERAVRGGARNGRQGARRGRSAGVRVPVPGSAGLSGAAPGLWAAGTPLSRPPAPLTWCWRRAAAGSSRRAPGGF